MLLMLGARAVSNHEGDPALDETDRSWCNPTMSNETEIPVLAHAPTIRPLIDYRRTAFSQYGEEGIISRIFSVLGPGSRLCCEFGAWDGVALSNTRELLLSGWTGILIEGDRSKFHNLQSTYRDGQAICLNEFVGVAENTLADILQRNGLGDRRLDFLSIDVDGPDFEIFSDLDRLRQPPRVVAVECINAHSPLATKPTPQDLIAAGVGQPLAVFVQRARELGYRLVCYLKVNAFFVHESEGHRAELPEVPVFDAWMQALDLVKQTPDEAQWLFRFAHGLTTPKHHYHNPFITAEALGISQRRARQLLQPARSDDGTVNLGKMMRVHFRRAVRAIAGRG